MLNFNFYNLIYFFAFYSFSGWCLEVLYYFKNERRFVNRGFLHGPFCPIYGFGVVFLVTFFDAYKDNILLLFFLGFFFTSVLEYFTGLFLEKTFKSKWWDYTDDPFNIQGYVCLPYSLLWGAGEVIIVNIVHPAIINVVENIPHTFGEIFISMIIIYLIIDFTLTIASLMQFDKFSYGFQFAPANFLFDKPYVLLGLTKERTIDKIKTFESILNKFKFNLNNRNPKYNFSNLQLNHIIKVIKEKIKRD
jgi:uncharacterized membrane protein